MDPLFFPTPAKWRSWLKKHHTSAVEVLVGFYKRDSGKPSITWPESVDEALCFGWIDGVRRSLGAESYTIRFTPRRKTSGWSAINIRRLAELQELGLVHEAGRKAFAERTKNKEHGYSIRHDRKDAALAPADVKQFKANAKAWAFYAKHPPWYRRSTAWWVTSAKKPETRAKRLAKLIDDCACERTLKELRGLSP